MQSQTETLNKLSTIKKMMICLYFIIAIILLITVMFLGVRYGAKALTLKTVWDAIFHYNSSLTSQQIIYELRFPRVIGATIIGAAFAVAGALMQGVTRNPLADTGVLGVNAGATFVVALSFAYFPNISYSYVIFLSFLGAILSTTLVFTIGSSSPHGLTPLRLTLAGAVVATLLHSLSSGIAIYFNLSQDLAFWFAGGLGGIRWIHIKALLPIILLVIIIAMSFGRSITLLSLGDQVASTLGLKVNVLRMFGLVLAVLLAGVSVSVAGSISFVGLVVPHIARKLVGVTYRLIIPMSAILGAILLTAADLAARVVHPPEELAISIMVAFVGVPFFLYIARKEGRDL